MTASGGNRRSAGAPSRSFESGALHQGRGAARAPRRGARRIPRLCGGKTNPRPRWVRKRTQGETKQIKVAVKSVPVPPRPLPEIVLANELAAGASEVATGAAGNNGCGDRRAHRTTQDARRDGPRGSQLELQSSPGRSHRFCRTRAVSRTC